MLLPIPSRPIIIQRKSLASAAPAGAAHAAHSSTPGVLSPSEQAMLIHLLRFMTTIPNHDKAQLVRAAIVAFNFIDKLLTSHNQIIKIDLPADIDGSYLNRVKSHSFKGQPASAIEISEKTVASPPSLPSLVPISTTGTLVTSTKVVNRPLSPALPKGGGPSYSRTSTPGAFKPPIFAEDIERSVAELNGLIAGGARRLLKPRTSQEFSFVSPAEASAFQRDLPLAYIYTGSIGAVTHTSEGVSIAQPGILVKSNPTCFVPLATSKEIIMRNSGKANSVMFYPGSGNDIEGPFKYADPDTLVFIDVDPMAMTRTINELQKAGCQNVTSTKIDGFDVVQVNYKGKPRTFYFFRQQLQEFIQYRKANLRAFEKAGIATADFCFLKSAEMLYCEGGIPSLVKRDEETGYIDLFNTFLAPDGYLIDNTRRPFNPIDESFGEDLFLAEDDPPRDYPTMIVRKTKNIPNLQTLQAHQDKIFHYIDKFTALDSEDTELPDILADIKSSPSLSKFFQEYPQKIQERYAALKKASPAFDSDNSILKRIRAIAAFIGERLSAPARPAEELAPSTPLTSPIITAPPIQPIHPIGTDFDFKYTAQILNCIRTGQSMQITNGPVIPARTAVDYQCVPVLANTDISGLTKVAHSTPNVEQQTTAQQIVVAHNQGYHPIALNFANEFSRGGNPGYKFDKEKYAPYQAGRAGAQEENLWEKSDLAIGLSEAAEYPFKSDQRAYVTENSLFAVDGADSQHSQFLDSAVPVSFVTSAGIDFRVNQCTQAAKENTVIRIRTHLKAAALAADRDRQANHNRPQELILGAFGCGAFAPNNHREYAQFIAQTYKALLATEEFAGIWEKVVFAIPCFQGDEKGGVNFQVFEEAFSEAGLPRSSSRVATAPPPPQQQHLPASSVPTRTPIATTITTPASSTPPQGSSGAVAVASAETVVKQVSDSISRGEVPSPAIMQIFVQTIIASSQASAFFNYLLRSDMFTQTAFLNLLAGYCMLQPPAPNAPVVSNFIAQFMREKCKEKRVDFFAIEQGIYSGKVVSSPAPTLVAFLRRSPFTTSITLPFEGQLQPIPYTLQVLADGRIAYSQGAAFLQSPTPADATQFADTFNQLYSRDLNQFKTNRAAFITQINALYEATPKPSPAIVDFIIRHLANSLVYFSNTMKSEMQSNPPGQFIAWNGMAFSPELKATLMQNEQFKQHLTFNDNILQKQVRGAPGHIAHGDNTCYLASVLHSYMDSPRAKQLLTVRQPEKDALADYQRQITPISTGLSGAIKPITDRVQRYLGDVYFLEGAMGNYQLRDVIANQDLSDYAAGIGQFLDSLSMLPGYLAIFTRYGFNMDAIIQTLRDGIANPVATGLNKTAFTLPAETALLQKKTTWMQNLLDCQAAMQFLLNHIAVREQILAVVARIEAGDNIESAEMDLLNTALMQVGLIPSQAQQDAVDISRKILERLTPTNQALVKRRIFNRASLSPAYSAEHPGDYQDSYQRNHFPGVIHAAGNTALSILEIVAGYFDEDLDVEVNGLPGQHIKGHTVTRFADALPDEFAIEGLNTNLGASHTQFTQFNEFLDMDGYKAMHEGEAAPMTLYGLTKIICHSGGGIGGHYTIFVKKAGQWYELDDLNSTIKPVAFTAVQKVAGSNGTAFHYQKLPPGSRLPEVPLRAHVTVPRTTLPTSTPTVAASTVHREPAPQPSAISAMLAKLPPNQKPYIQATGTEPRSAMPVGLTPEGQIYWAFCHGAIRITSGGQPRTFDEILHLHQDAVQAKDEMDQLHDFIQLILPNSSPTGNCRHAPLPMLADFCILAGDPMVKQKTEQAIATMVQYWDTGIDRSASNHGVAHRNPITTHNNLRIIRAVKCALALNLALPPGIWEWFKWALPLINKQLNSKSIPNYDDVALLIEQVVNKLAHPQQPALPKPAPATSSPSTAPTVTRTPPQSSSSSARPNSSLSSDITRAVADIANPATVEKATNWLAQQELDDSLGLSPIASQILNMFASQTKEVRATVKQELRLAGANAEAYLCKRFVINPPAKLSENDVPGIIEHIISPKKETLNNGTCFWAAAFGQLERGYYRDVNNQIKMRFVQAIAQKANIQAILGEAFSDRFSQAFMGEVIAQRNELKAQWLAIPSRLTALTFPAFLQTELARRISAKEDIGFLPVFIELATDWEALDLHTAQIDVRAGTARGEFITAMLLATPRPAELTTLLTRFKKSDDVLTDPSVLLRIFQDHQREFGETIHALPETNPIRTAYHRYTNALESLMDASKPLILHDKKFVTAYAHCITHPLHYIGDSEIPLIEAIGQCQIHIWTNTDENETQFRVQTREHASTANNHRSIFMHNNHPRMGMHFSRFAIDEYQPSPAVQSRPLPLVPSTPAQPPRPRVEPTSPIGLNPNSLDIDSLTDFFARICSFHAPVGEKFKNLIQELSKGNFDLGEHPNLEDVYTELTQPENVKLHIDQIRKKMIAAIPAIFREPIARKINAELAQAYSLEKIIKYIRSFFQRYANLYLSFKRIDTSADNFTCIFNAVLGKPDPSKDNYLFYTHPSLQPNEDNREKIFDDIKGRYMHALQQQPQDEFSRKLINAVNTAVASTIQYYQTNMANSTLSWMAAIIDVPTFFSTLRTGGMIIQDFFQVIALLYNKNIYLFQEISAEDSHYIAHYDSGNPSAETVYVENNDGAHYSRLAVSPK